MMTQMVSRKDQILAVHRMLLLDAVGDTCEDADTCEDDDTCEDEDMLEDGALFGEGILYGEGDLLGEGGRLVVEEQLDAEVDHLYQMDAAYFLLFHSH